MGDIGDARSVAACLLLSSDVIIVVSIMSLSGVRADESLEEEKALLERVLNAPTSRFEPKVDARGLIIGDEEVPVPLLLPGLMFLSTRSPMPLGLTVSTRPCPSIPSASSPRSQR